jgi:hypothetical protein
MFRSGFLAVLLVVSVACTQHPAPQDATVSSLAGALDRTVAAMGEPALTEKVRDAQADRLGWRLASAGEGPRPTAEALQARAAELVKRYRAASGGEAPRILVWMGDHAAGLDADQRNLLLALCLQAEQELGGPPPAPSLP